MGLALELKMSRPFALAEEEATLAIFRTAEVVAQRTSEVLKRFDVTPAQYNVLRILQGSPDGLACRDVSERLIAHDPDVTRLLDRMEARHWIKRRRCSSDRRVVIACVTSTGLELLDEIKPMVSAFHKQQFKDWGDKQLGQLLELLQRVRDTKPQITRRPSND